MTKIQSFDTLINEMQQSLEKFKNVIANPEESIELVGRFGAAGNYNGTHIEKINYYCFDIKIHYALLKLCLNIILSQREIKLEDKQQELSESLKKEFFQLRKTSYQAYIREIGSEKLLNEAQQYYLASFRHDTNEIIRTFLKSADISPKVKEIIFQDLSIGDLSNEEYEAIKISVEKMTLDEILPKLKERVIILKEKEYDIIEMEEIISKLESK